jgi:inorganic pyrophosphatase
LKDSTVWVIVEIPKGSRNKYEYDPELGRIKLDRMLFSSVQYPTDYGFIPDTLAEDGDTLDAMVMVSEPTYPGIAIEARPIGLFRMYDEKGRDDKILCVPVHDPTWNYAKNLDDIPQHLLREIDNFFTIYKELEEKKTGVEGWEEVESAFEVIVESEKRWQSASR